MIVTNILDTIKIYIKLITSLIVSHFFHVKNENMHDTKMLLVIASHLPPNSNGGVFRPLSFIRNAKKNGWTCKAFSFDYPLENPSAGTFLLNKLDDQSILERVRLLDLKPSWKLTPRIDGGFVNSLEMFGYIIKKKIERPSIILASGPQFNTFITGYLLSKYYKTHLVLDYRDEWSLCPFSWVTKGSSDNFFENMVSKQASKLIFTTASHIQNHASHFPNIPNSKRILIANGYDEEDLCQVSDKIPTNERFTLSFIGALGDHSLPDFFLKDLEYALSERPELLNNICVQFIGNKSPIAKDILSTFKFQDNIKLFDHISKPEALRMMIESDTLLILANDGMKNYIPGKLFDYLSVKRPILYYGEESEASMIINNLKAGFSVEKGDKGKLLTELLSLVKGEIILDSAYINAWLKNYTREHLAKNLFIELDSLS